MSCPHFKDTTFKWSDVPPPRPRRIPKDESRIKPHETPGIVYCDLREGGYPENKCIGHPYLEFFRNCKIFQETPKDD